MLGYIQTFWYFVLIQFLTHVFSHLGPRQHYAPWTWKQLYLYGYFYYSPQSENTDLKFIGRSVGQGLTYVVFFRNVSFTIIKRAPRFCAQTSLA